jgi:quinohemoprotein amine dehydrogenase
MPDAIAIYDRIDYIKVNQDTAMASFRDETHGLGYQQFEAIGYQNGTDGKRHTADDLELGPVDVTWSIKVFYESEGSPTESVGTMSSTGLFTPANESPHNNFDVWIIAQSATEKDDDGKPLTGKSYLVVTVPVYTFNGRRYVRDLDRWVDDGPARPAR